MVEHQIIEESSGLSFVVASLVGEREKFSIKYILNGDDCDIWEDLGHDEILKSVVYTIKSSDRNTGERSDVEEERDNMMLDISFTEKIKAIRIVMRINEMDSDINLELQRRLRRLVRSQRRARSTGLRQAKVDGFPPVKRVLTQ